MSDLTLDAPATTAASVPLRRRRKKPKLFDIVVWCGVGLLLVVEVYPLIWLILGSFKQQDEFLSEPFWSLPRSWGFDNYESAFVEGGLGTYIRNSVLVVFPALFFILAFGAAAGYALEVLVWKGRGVVLLTFLVGIMMPLQMILLPLFTIYFNLELTGTLWPLIITYTAIGMPLTVFMMATYLRAVPRELFDAAAIDGAGVYRAFWFVALPMMRNAIFTVGLVQFFFLWNDLLIALTFTNSQDLRTIQVGLLNFTGQYGAVQYGPIFAGISVNVVGTLAIYLFLNQKVMRGLTAGSVKG